MTASGLWLPVGLIALNIYALLLVVARGPVFGTRVYRPMILNIGLSLAPAAMMAVSAVFALILVIWAGQSAVGPAWLPSLLMWTILIVGGVAWFVMLPNAAYLITELNMSHRRPGENVPLWYDIVLVMTLALSGIFNTLANLALAQFIMAMLIDLPAQESAADPRPYLAVGLVVILVSFGIYIGRYLRLNSWDLLHPASLIRKFAAHFGTRGNFRTALGFVLVHSVLLLILYAIVLLPAVTRLLSPAIAG